VEPVQSAAPQITLTQVSAEPAAGKRNWKIQWRVANSNSQRLEICAVRLPHGQFKSAEQRFAPAIHLAPNDSAEFEVFVSCDEAEGLVTENAFLIFQVVRLDERWRIFTRVRVTVDAFGTPVAATELITTQRVGFSEVIS
jgi:hypothetical protein